ncbi:hypothetical protein D3C76_1229620 [compost metagenome]
MYQRKQATPLEIQPLRLLGQPAKQGEGGVKGDRGAGHLRQQIGPIGELLP